jgi:DNA polymerase III sliding clamp (beta) subunit (PCNA family)
LSDILSALRFVQGAVAKKDFVPAMTHFRIEKGTVRSFNGNMGISTPIALDLECTPKAETLVRAIANCEETAVLSMTQKGRLKVQSGKFKAFIENLEGEVPHVTPAGDIVQIDGAALLDSFQKISSFVGNDASRPWTNGILLRGQSAFATNNVCLIEYWLAIDIPFVVNIPGTAVDEIIRVNEPPSHLQLSNNSVTFHYNGGRWIRTQLYVTQWPDISRVLDQPSNPLPIDPKLYKALENLTMFSDDLTRIYIKDGVLKTHLEDEMGASYEVDGLGITGLYQIKMLQLLEGVAETADFSRYPNPVLFFGKNLRGAIVGMRG